MSLPSVDLRESVHGQLLDNALLAIKAIPLNGLDNDRVLLRKYLWNSAVTIPAPFCIVAPAYVNVDFSSGPVGADEVVHGIAIAIVAAGNRDSTDLTLPILLLWEETIRQTFNRQRAWSIELSSGNCIKNCQVVSPSSIFMEAAALVGWDAQYTILACRTQEQRQ